MVFRKEMLVLIISVTAVLWIQTTSFGLPKKGVKKMSKEVQQEKEKIFQCFDALNCVLGDEYYQILKDQCYKVMTEQDAALLAKFASDVGYKGDASNYDEYISFYCSHEKETRRKIFDYSRDEMITHTSNVCSQGSSDCARLELLLNCVATHMHKHNILGDCGAE